MSDIPVGTIVMYSGTTMPAHWVLCDGKNNTPDLRDRFILGGELHDVGGQSAEKTTGDKDKKHFELNTNKSSSGISVTVSEHKLTVSEMPEHYHKQGDMYDYNYGFAYGEWTDPSDGQYINGGAVKTTCENRHAPLTQNAGQGEGHSHHTDVEVQGHSHSADVTAPYYILAFIMYQGS
ncbi:phage tail protein [Enterobacter cancerogenus]|uniref:phage tail protein n=1 Tax=Enterobacter cancerogenus TaxID=69218 RepID=UPI001299D966|nr:phage tail protein [Enterobacter cancerogenus]QGG11664.1 hypothetical protein GH771_23195 [Enterobacter cancerogenus]